MKFFIKNIFFLLIFDFFGVCIAHSEQTRNTIPVIEKLNYSIVHPWKKSNEPIKSEVKFTYRYQVADINAHAYDEAKAVVQMYIRELLKSQTIGSPDTGVLNMTVDVTNKTEGVFKKGSANSVAEAAGKSVKKVSYFITIKYYALTTTGSGKTKTIHRKRVRVENQEFYLSGSASFANIQIKCVNDDALKIANSLF